MPELMVTGKCSLRGKITISGAKNAVLPQMAASLLTSEKVILTNVPDITDVGVMKSVLEAYGVRVKWYRPSGTLELKAESPTHQLPEKNVGESIRASFLVFGPLLARKGEANVYRPGGCSIQQGGRPVDFHVDAMKDMKAKMIREYEGEDEEEDEEQPRTQGLLPTLHGPRCGEEGALRRRLDEEVISMKAEDGLKPGRITFKKSSVGATETAMMAASLVQGETVIRHTDIEPEIYDLKKMLSLMGARIVIQPNVEITEDITQFGITEPIKQWNVITVEGRKSLRGVNHEVMPDRIEFGTYAIAAAMTNGKIQLEVKDDMKESMLTAIRQPLVKAGVKINEGKRGIVEVSLENGNITPVDIKTGPYPGFPTDLLPQWVAFMTQAQPTRHKRSTTIHDKIFDDRFKFVEGLIAMKANIEPFEEIDGKKHRILAGKELKKATVVAPDLRGGAALVLAALVAEGSTVVKEYENVLRGYENMVGKCNACGAKLEILPPSRPGHYGGPRSF